MASLSPHDSFRIVLLLYMMYGFYIEFILLLELEF